jgi:hypothetical protein
MQSFAQFMTGATVTPGLDVQPDKGQTWQFPDGRQGIVASVDVTCAMVYVGPEPFRVPRGDWAIVFGTAALVQPPAATPAPTLDASVDVTAPVDSPAVILGLGKHNAVAAADDSPAFPPGFGERFPPGGPPVAESAAPSTFCPAPGKSSRNRKR